ncbi:TonB-dependent receptor [Sphingobium algorifonticola]|uniref:TonB-dependent receptor n=1 Tax=Sphingobium algorifonticola TaxID=2008318 RepID=A0A437JA69_9SPHN|nr:TonB-dependent receptor [Sphingobium algorifonticola]
MILGAALFAVPATAQDVAAQASTEEASVDEGSIVVTGSRIARPDLEVSSPVRVLGREEITLRAPTTAEELLRDLPSARPNLGPGVNNGSDGSSSIDLRGIGPNRTLVLLDGRRIVPFGLDGITDLNTIPIALVDRVDVVTGGASSVYGADAVAGVVNFVTKRDFTGIDLSANYRITERGDAAAYQADLVTGASFDDGRGNAVLAFGYTKSDPLNQDSRSFGVAALNTVDGQPQGSQTAVPAFLLGPVLPGVTNNGLGYVINPTTGAFQTATSQDLYNFNPDNLYQTPLERYNIYGSARYEISDAIEMYSTAMFTSNKVSILSAASGTFTNPYFLPLSNPYLPDAARNQLCSAISLSAAQCTAADNATSATDPNYREVPVTLARRFVEYGPRFQSVDTTQFQIQAGLRGKVTEGINFDVSAQFGETNQNQTRENWGSYSRVQQSLRSFNTTTCSNTANGCVPINLFGPAGSITPSMLGFIDLDSYIRRTVQQTVVTGSINGDLFGATSPLTDSPIAFSIGAEYRKLTAESNPDGSARIQSEVLGTGARTPQDFGTYNVKEAFGELIVPLITDTPFFYNLTLEAGIRYSDYSTTGTSTTWKAGGSWEPVEGFKFCGMYQRAVRSPNIQELFQSPVTGLSSLAVDPCQSTLPVGNAALSALCVATGAPAASIGSIPSPSANQINATTSGNPNLDVERARTITLGAVFAPRFVPGLSITVDYFDIRVTDAITTPAQGDILNGCYSTSLNPTLTFNSFCALIGRNPINGSLNGAGETLGVVLASSNLGIIDTSGVDLSINYRIPVGEGALSFGFNGTYLDHYTFQATPNAITRDCTGYYSTNCTNPRPEYKWNLRTTYSNGPVRASVLWRHISGVDIEPAAQTPRPPLTTPQTGGPNPATVFDAYESIPAYNYFDLALGADVADNLELNLLVSNLFDKQPPIVGSGAGGTAFNNGNTFPTTYDVLGRSYTISARLKF